MGTFSDAVTYRKKPVVVQAVQYITDAPASAVNFLVAGGHDFKFVNAGLSILTDTLHKVEALSWSAVNHGSWLVRNSAGLLVTMTHEQFSAEYETAS